MNALALCVLSAALSFADEAPTFGAKFIGENSRSRPVTTGPVAEYLEEAPRQAAPKELAQATEHAAPQAQLPRETMEAQAPQSGVRMGAFLVRGPMPAARKDKLADAVGQPLPPAVKGASPGQAARGYSLWESVGAPVQMTPQKISETGLEDAQAVSREEYERRILGQTPGALRPMTPSPKEEASSGQLFVSVELAMSEKTELKDAVAGFSSVSGFTMDPRFAAASGGLGATRASVRGWLPASRLADAIQAPGVLRVEIDHGAPNLRPNAATASLVVGLRMPAQENAGEAFQRILADLTARSGFKWTRTIGFQSLPDSREVALVVVGEVPVARISKVMEHPAVLKVAPAPGIEEAATASPAAAAPKAAARSGFWKYARTHAPALLILTALMVLSPLGGLGERLFRSFVPYRRR